MELRVHNLLIYSALTVVAVALAYVGLTLWAQRVEEDRETAGSRALREVEAGKYSFLAWYNGWGRLDAWGIGAIQSAKCGDRDVSIQYVYDTHLVAEDPKYDETVEYVESYNSTVLTLLERKGVECSFEYYRED